MDGINRRLDTAQERSSELKDRRTGNFQVKHREKKERKTEQSAAGVCDMTKRSNASITGMPEGQKQGDEAGKNFQANNRVTPPNDEGDQHGNPVCASNHSVYPSAVLMNVHESTDRSPQCSQSSLLTYPLLRGCYNITFTVD